MEKLKQNLFQDPKLEESRNTVAGLCFTRVTGGTGCRTGAAPPYDATVDAGF